MCPPAHSSYLGAGPNSTVRDQPTSARASFSGLQTPWLSRHSARPLHSLPPLPWAQGYAPSNGIDPWRDLGKSLRSGFGDKEFQDPRYPKCSLEWVGCAPDGLVSLAPTARGSAEGTGLARGPQQLKDLGRDPQVPRFQGGNVSSGILPKQAKLIQQPVSRELYVNTQFNHRIKWT